MLGSGIGKLSVLVKNNDGSDQRIIWEKSGEQGNEWKQASVEVTSSVPYQVHTMNTVFPRISTHAVIAPSPELAPHPSSLIVFNSRDLRESYLICFFFQIMKLQLKRNHYRRLISAPPPTFSDPPFSLNSN